MISNMILFLAITVMGKEYICVLCPKPKLILNESEVTYPNTIGNTLNLLSLKF